MMKFIMSFIEHKPKNVTRKKKAPAKKTNTNTEKKFKRLLKSGYSINRARYLSKM